MTNATKEKPKTYNKLTAAEWTAVRAAYETRNPAPSMLSLATEFGVSYQTIQSRRKKDGWRISPLGAPPLPSGILDTGQKQPSAVSTSAQDATKQADAEQGASAQPDAAEAGLVADRPFAGKSFAEAYGLSPAEAERRGEAFWKALKDAPTPPPTAAAKKGACQKCGENSLLVELQRCVRQPGGVVRIPATCCSCGTFQYQIYKFIETELPEAK